MMASFYKLFPALCLVLSIQFLTAQTISWQPLNGPSGSYVIRNMASDAAGQLFMVMDRKIYKSTDQGDSWTLCMAGISQTNTSTAKFLRAPNGTFYVYFDLSIDIELYRYQPAGNSWALVNLPFGNYELDGIDIDPQGRMWVSTDASLSIVHYSTDGGQTFQQVTNSGQMEGWFNQLATFSDAHNLIAVGYGSSQKLYHFTRAGAVQQVISGSPMRYLGYNPYSGTAFFSDYDNFKRSANGGLNWQNIALGGSGSPQISVSNMFFEPSGRIWAQAPYGLYFSDDDGLSWTIHAALNTNPATFYRTDDKHWFATNSCGAPQFSRTANMGVSWTDLSKQFQFPHVRDIQKDAANNLYALTCAKSAYEISPNGGQIWSDFVITDGAPVLVNSLAVRPDGLILAVGANGKYYRSFDNGGNWSELTTINNPFPGWPHKFYIDQNGTCYFASDFGGAWRSTDSGNTWQALQLDWYNSEPVFHPNGDIFYLDYTYGFHYHANGDSVSMIEIPGLQFFDVYQIHCTAKGTVFLSGRDVFAGGNYSMYRIPNGGSIPELLPSFPGINGVYAIRSNVEGDVFIFTSSIIYKSEDEGTTWTNVGQIPPFNLTTIYVAPDQYLYTGYAGTVIHRSAEPLAEANFITGRVWVENDGDCSFDVGENLLPYTPIIADGAGNYTGFTGYNGKFLFTAPSGNYSLNVQPPNALYAPCFSNVPISLNGPNDSATVDLPLLVVAQCPYLSVNLSTPTLRRCFDVVYTVFYKNEGTVPAPDAYVTVMLDSFFVFQNSSLPIAGQNGLAYTFDLGTLAAGQSGAFKIVVQVSCNATLGQTHCISAHIFPDDLCLPTLPPRANYEECRMNIGAYDPNDKRVFVNGKEEPGFILPDTEIEYLIRFQNTGTDTAFRVVVEDRLPGTLELSSLTPVAASHPYTLELRDQRVLRFVFDNIQLPDSNINEAASHGFIKFRIAQTPGLALGTVIRNEADIFFDFNAPIRTNSSSLIVGIVRNQPEPGNPYSVTAWPNPFEASVSFEISGPDLPGPGTLRLFDPLGRQLLQERFFGKRVSLNGLILEPGLYYFLMESAGQRVAVGKVVAR